MAGNDPTIRFYFDYISSNAYLAWTQLHALAERYGRSVEPVPVLFAGLLEAHGQLGPAEVLPKSLWMIRNNLRKAALLGVSLHPPAHHPWNPLLPLRLSSLPLAPDVRKALVDAFFAAFWSRGLHASEPEGASRVLGELGLDAASLISEARTPEAKQRLREQTDAAIARGVFGVPALLADGELFWGYDDFPMLERCLAGKDPLDPTELTGWLGVRPSATRRRAGVPRG